MDVFALRNKLIDDYASYVTSFIEIKDEHILEVVRREIADGLMWPDPLIQLNPAFEPGASIDELASEGLLHEECSKIFRLKDDPKNHGKSLRLHKHQDEAIRIGLEGYNFVLTTGTGSGKSLAYIIPIVNHVLQRGSGKGTQAIIVYPMNALANSQIGELEKFINYGYPDEKGPITFERYTGQENFEEKNRIMSDPPDILLTNYVMLELILTRPQERRTLVNAAKGLRFLVLDELHTYRGRQGADVAMLVRRVRDALLSEDMQCIGTSATLAGSGTYEEQRREVAAVASQIFGEHVKPEHIIGETLRRATPERDLNDPVFVDQLRERIQGIDQMAPTDYETFVRDPLSIWIESMFGIRKEPGNGRLIRAVPRSISGDNGAAGEMSRLIDLEESKCGKALEEGLLAAYRFHTNSDLGFPPFAFRLHQFIRRGDTVYASLEGEEKRHITVYGQQFVPGDRKRILLPLVFCRECGQEYYSVRLGVGEDERRVLFPRDLSDRQKDDTGEAGFVFFSTSDPWPDDSEAVLERLPDDWVEEHRGALRVRRNRKKDLPRKVRFATSGWESDEGIDTCFIGAPFRFCLSCGVAYDFRQRSDFMKLTALGTGGRSTATTILSLAAIRSLRKDESLPEEARKLLSFTDNRQDAALQSGHFNDFVEVAILRAGLYHSAVAAGKDGISHDELTQKVFDALQLPLEIYAVDPVVRFQAKAETEQAFRDVLGYRLYRDLRRGWRIISPNLEQCGLLEIHYKSLEDVCQAEDVWEGKHPALVSASVDIRIKVAKTLLDFMRRELAIKVDYLDRTYQERIQQRSSQRLIAPWAIDENEKLEFAAELYPRPRGQWDSRENVFLSARGGFGQYLRRSPTFPEYGDKLKLEDTRLIIEDLLEGLKVAGLVEVVREPKNKDDVPGYQLPASALTWRAGDGIRAFHDPIRIPAQPEEGGQTNRFFVEFYKNVAGSLQGIEAREHTAQVDYDDRQDREERFRDARLPILFCSPTMELGVDISELNVVNMRNIPPTPSNYAQRSGRAGRSGQPALVYSYCAVGNSHDQYFFKRPNLMVAGAVTPPRLDLANEDLVRAHIQAIWLAETNVSLGSSLKDVLDLESEDPSLELLDFVRGSIESDRPRQRAKERAKKLLGSIENELQASDWHSDHWLDEVFDQIILRFDQACDRWRGLYRSALQQSNLQTRVVQDASRSQRDKNQAKRLRREAESQLDLLTDAKSVVQSDFYSYRYFASEGFLPGYSFPRLPLSAYIPGRRRKKSDGEYINRPRFLAISEFGPRSIVYHEGSRYIINKVILPVEAEEEQPATGMAKQCPLCSYLHPIAEGDGPDLCEHCRAPLDQPMRNLFRLQNVSTKRRDRISSDEEERLRQGYEICTGIRFSEQDGRPKFRSAAVERDGEVLLRFKYGSAATLWRINLGWRRRANPNLFGFVLDLERGYWARSEQQAEEDPEDPMSVRTKRVIPYVEDRRNCLILEPTETLDGAVMASLQAALKNAIQVEYQLEDNELAAEPLPSRDKRKMILFYEAAEGGAGVLRRLVDDNDAFSKVAKQALSLCHFDPETGEDLRRAPRSREDCEAACYDCMMSYTNQMDHQLLDRQEIKDILLKFAGSKVKSAPAPTSRAEHLARLMNLAGSELEKNWLQFLEEHNYRLPSHAQRFVDKCKTRPDFFYKDYLTAIYIDGPHHDYPDRAERDKERQECMEDLGFTVIRFSHTDDWEPIVGRYPNIFG